jgi:predicted ATPase
VDEPIAFELKCRERPGMSLITYHLAIDEDEGGPYVEEEWLRWRRKGTGRPYKFLDFRDGVGEVISGEEPDEEDERVRERLDSPEMLAVNTLGQLAKHPRVGALRRFITGWYLSYLSADATRGVPEAGPQERLSSTGDNLPNVVQYLRERHADRLGTILDALSRRVPKLERVDAEPMQDGRLLLLVKDAPFERPVLARYASDGTLKTLAYLTLLYDPAPPQLIGIEEPENQIHPRILTELVEECRAASERSQLLITTHSPVLVDALRPEELWVLHRDGDGFTRARRASGIQGIGESMHEGATLGQLWLEGYLDDGPGAAGPGTPFPARDAGGTARGGG